MELNIDKNVSSCVMNNGFTTAPFMVSRGVRQGDPLSPYLFIIALETLAIKIRSDNSINGFRIGELTKLSLFADDMTCFLHDKGRFLPPRYSGILWIMFWSTCKSRKN